MTWTMFEEREPTEENTVYGYLLVWHVFAGVIAVRLEDRHANSMYTHWARPPGRGWVDARERWPTPEDADKDNCVLARRDDETFIVTGWHQFRTNRHLTHWAHLPAPPENAAEIRKKWMA